MRLRKGTDSSNGRVEICQFTTWGGVCSDEWDENDARVVCGQLGYDPEGLYIHSKILLYQSYINLYLVFLTFRCKSHTGISRRGCTSNP